MNLQLTPEQARAQLAGLQKQKDVVDRSIKMLAETGTQLHNAVAETVEVSTDMIAVALREMIAVQILGLSLQQEGLAANIAALENLLRGGGLVLPTFLGPERKA